MTGRRPQLDSAQLARLPAGFADFPPRFAEPGMSLHDIVCTRTYDREWLEAAVRGGFVPSIEGIGLALKALVLVWEAHRDDHRPEDCLDGQSPCWDFEAFFRAFAAGLTREADRMTTPYPHGKERS